MNSSELRYKIISTLLQSSDPITLDELLKEIQVGKQEVEPVLQDLVDNSLVVTGDLIPEKPSPQYCWGTRWEQRVEKRESKTKKELRSAYGTREKLSERKLNIDSKPVLEFYRHIIEEYKPPEDKKYLVFLQCSVRRPFSASPSHGSMRRAIRIATGYDPSPSKDFRQCPVHVVVMASKMGPVPYELEDMYPANVRGGGVKHFNQSQYEYIKPILSERIAQYIITHRHNYEHITTFTEGRYADVMKDAKAMVVEWCGKDYDFPILPKLDGPQIIRMGKSMPRKYWEKYWIQLYLETVSWLDEDMQKAAEKRLEDMDVKYYEGIGKPLKNQKRRKP
ncbi:hypothetical protein GF312_16870 [Candidatus Poribacteria bacterium]|nr:hypothetical protein [Candidatus Poribacteria bacterium]